MNYLIQLAGLILCLFVGALGLTIIVWIWTGKIDLSHLLDEANGHASMSRFQLLLFSFVIAMSLFELVATRGTAGFPEIPSGVLTLLGISATTYAVGKGISYSQPDIMASQSEPAADADEQNTTAKAQGAGASGSPKN